MPNKRFNKDLYYYKQLHELSCGRLTDLRTIAYWAKNQPDQLEGYLKTMCDEAEALQNKYVRKIEIIELMQQIIESEQ